MSDPVHSPDHYRWLPVEVIEITEHLGFCMGNVIKYVLRADHKGKPIEDLKKAAWYLEREIARREAATAPVIEDCALGYWPNVPSDRLGPFQTPHNARYDDEQHVRGEG